MILCIDKKVRAGMTDQEIYNLLIKIDRGYVPTLKQKQELSSVINQRRKTHMLACGMKAAFL